MEFTIRPIDHWPKNETPSHKRRSRFTFSASWSETVKLLDAELRHLKANQIVIQADVSERDIRLDGMLRANAIPASPRIILSFNSKHGPISYPCDSCEFWQHNVRSIALALQALRAVDRYGVTAAGEQYKGWAKLESNEKFPIPKNYGHALSIAREKFGFSNVEDLMSDVRRWVIDSHPDRGGDSDEFKQARSVHSLLEGM